MSIAVQLADVTPLLVTYNEEANLAQTLQCISWARRVVVVDSGSDDGTLAIATSYPNVEVHQRVFDTHSEQWNYGLSLIRTAWVLTLDADYRCPPGLATELVALSSGVDVYFAEFRYCVFGRPIRASLYPPRAVLFRSAHHRYVQDGHTQLLDTSGFSCSQLRSIIEHDDRKPLSRWIGSQVKYAFLEADKLISGDRASLGWKDRIRAGVVWAPFLTFAYCLLYKRLAFCGWPGWLYTTQRVFAELLLSLVLLDRRLRKA